MLALLSRVEVTSFLGIQCLSKPFASAVGSDSTTCARRECNLPFALSITGTNHSKMRVSGANRYEIEMVIQNRAWASCPLKIRVRVRNL